MLDAVPAAGPVQGARAALAPALRDAATSAVETVRTAEIAAAGALTGEVGTREAVDAVMAAERTVRTAAAIRDKLVSGWLDISRMSI